MNGRCKLCHMIFKDLCYEAADLAPFKIPNLSLRWQLKVKLTDFCLFGLDLGVNSILDSI